AGQTTEGVLGVRLHVLRRPRLRLLGCRPAEQVHLFLPGGGSYAAEFRAFWEYAYGTPQNPQSPRLDNVFLAPGARSTPGNKKVKPSVAIDNLIDDEVFRPNAAIELKLQNNQPLTPYEEYRLELDKLLDKNQWEWQQRVHGTVYEHYDTVKH